MRSLLHAVCFLAVMGLAFWAYRENYATQAALNEVDALQQEIADLREALAIQRAEWAYLNRPDRLRELAALNFDRLGLLPLEPGQLGSIGAVAFPAPPSALDALPMDAFGPVDLSGTLDPDAADTREIVPTNEEQVP